MPHRSLRNFQIDEIEPIEEVYMNQRMANLTAVSNEKQPSKETVPPELLRKL